MLVLHMIGTVDGLVPNYICMWHVMSCCFHFQNQVIYRYDAVEFYRNIVQYKAILDSYNTLTHWSLGNVAVI